MANLPLQDFRAELVRLTSLIDHREDLPSQEKEAASGALKDLIESLLVEEHCCCDGIVYCREHNPSGRLA